MRLLILSSMYPRTSDPSAGIFVHKQVKSVRDKGCEVMVISPRPIPTLPTKDALSKWRNLYELKGCAELEEIRVIYHRYLSLPPRVFKRYSYFLPYHSMKRILRREINTLRPNLIHAHRAVPSGFLGLLLRKEFGLPLVVSLRGSDINVHPFESQLNFDLTNRVISEADRVIAVSYALKAKAEEISLPSQQIEVIYNGCDTGRFLFDKAVRASLRRKLGIPIESIVYIFVGHLVKEKGVFELVRGFNLVASRQSESYLVLVGQGKDEGLLAEEISRVSLGHRIFLMGPQPYEEISGWLSMADVLVHPSWREGLPNVVVEAMACERPVVGSKTGGIPEAVENGKSGILVEPKSPVELAEAMEELAKDSKLRHTMGKAGRAIVIRKFSQEKSAEQLLGLYEKIIEKRANQANLLEAGKRL